MRKPHEQSASEVDLATPTAEGGQSLYGVSSDYSLPVLWNSARLEDLAIKIQDGTHFSPKSQTGPFRYLTSKHIRFGYLDIGDCGWISHAEHREIFRRCDVAKGDVLLTKDGANTGNAALNSLDEPFSLLSSVAMIRCNPTRLHAGYLLQYLLSSATQKRLKDAMSGNAISRVTLEKIKALRVIGPQDTNEQRRIAAVLDTVDEAIAMTEAMLAKLKGVRAGLLHHLLTRGIDEHDQLRDSIAHPEQFQDSPLGQIPREWRWSKFDDVLTGIEAGKSPDYPDYPAPPGEWGVLKVSAIWPEGFRPYENKRVTKAMHQNLAYEVYDGDLLISRSNTYELVGIVSLVRDAPPRLMLCDKTLRLKLKPDRGLNPFFALLLQTRTARCQIEVNATGTSGSMKNISQGVIRGLVLAYPEIEEQHRILAVMALMDQELEVLGRELGKLLALKSGLLSDLLTGRVRVPEEVAVVP